MLLTQNSFLAFPKAKLVAMGSKKIAIVRVVNRKPNVSFFGPFWSVFATEIELFRSVFRFTKSKPKPTGKPTRSFSVVFFPCQLHQQRLHICLETPLCMDSPRPQEVYLQR